MDGDRRMFEARYELDGPGGPTTWVDGTDWPKPIALFYTEPEK